MSKSSKNSQMFNLSETVIPRSLSNMPQAELKHEHVFAQGEISLQNYLKDSYAKVFQTLDRFWAEGVRLLQAARTRCYEMKPDLADLLDEEFGEVELLEKFKIGNTASKDNFEEVRPGAFVTRGVAGESRAPAGSGKMYSES